MLDPDGSTGLLFDSNSLLGEPYLQVLHTVFVCVFSVLREIKHDGELRQLDHGQTHSLCCVSK